MLGADTTTIRGTRTMDTEVKTANPAGWTKATSHEQTITLDPPGGVVLANIFD